MCLSCRNDTGGGPGVGATSHATGRRLARDEVPNETRGHTLQGSSPGKSSGLWQDCTERTQGPRSMRAQRASVRISSSGDPTRIRGGAQESLDSDGSNDGRCAPRSSIPVPDKPIASGGWRACPSPGAMQSQLSTGGRAKRRKPRSSAPLTTEARIMSGATPGTSIDASAASVGPHLFLGRPHIPGEKSGIPRPGSDQRRGRAAPPVLLASFLRSKTSDVQGRRPPHPYASLFIRTK
jgi:hypothetical protein